MKRKESIHVIGCGVLGPELSSIAQNLSVELKINFLPGKLHNTPDILRKKLQEAIDKASADPNCSRIIVGYGLCGRGSVGIKSRNVPFVIPRVHDCIALFLGSDDAYREQFSKFPGTYYVTEGWYDEKEKSGAHKEKKIWVGSEAMGCSELTDKFGSRNGKFIEQFFSSWKNNYQRAAYIDTGVGRRQKSLKSAQRLAAENNWKFEKLPGSLALLEKLFTCTSSDKSVLFVPPDHITLYSAADDGLISAPQEEAGKNLAGLSKKIRIEGTNTEGQHSSSHTLGLGIDAGGTYTDGILFDFATGKIIQKNKALTTKWDFSIGIRECLMGLDSSKLSEVDLVSVSTTLATNAIVEGEGQKTALILMNGEKFGQQISHSPKVCIQGILSISGKEVEPVDEQEVVRIAKTLVDKEGVSAFAVSGFGGSVNPIHECKVKEIIQRETGLVVCCGHELSSKLNFLTRAQTAVVNGRIIPKVLRFFTDLDEMLSDFSISAPVMVVKGDGTLMRSEMALQKPVETILSGPAASVAGARHITGLQDGFVVDIGGTTTDTGDIVDGEVSIAESGATVGSIQTHVQALKMKTIGLGGDSHIRFTDGKFSIGPRRVAPLVWADENCPSGITLALQTMSERPLRRQQQLILVAMETTFDFEPTQEEVQIYTLLKRHPLSIEKLAERLSILSPSLLKLQRLEEKGLVLRCGLTPTDLLHASGAYRKWAPEPAQNYIQYIAGSLGNTVEKLLVDLENSVVLKLAQAILKNSVFQEMDEEAIEENPLYPSIIHSLFPENNNRYGLKPDFAHPVIGIGAPASHFLPKAANILQTECVVPEDADVANAIGAITSHILLRRALTIVPKGNGKYSVKGVVDNPDFPSLQDAENWAMTFLRDQLRQEGKVAGTAEDSIDVDIDDSVSTLNDGSLLFLERTVSARLKGLPQ